MALSTQQQILVEARLANEGKSMLLAYVFWFFLGFFAAHRFYLKSGVAWLQLVLNFLIVGLIWTFIDAFLIVGMVNKSRDEARRRIVADVVAHAPA
jgi:large-conductance mechanosensitive channel